MSQNSDPLVDIVSQEDWTDEESLAASDSARAGGSQGEDSDMIEMLYGQGISAELLAESALDRPSVDQIDDEERMRDPMVLVDIRVSTSALC